MKTKYLTILIALLCLQLPCRAADTLRVMTYNVLNYGELPSCQGPVANYHQYLRTIVAYAHPDVLGLVKMGAVKRTPTDAAGNAPYGFGDSVLDHALNAAFANRYAYCPVTNTAAADAVSMLFYNKQQLGYLATIVNYAKTTDFNVFKFYYRDPALAQTRDTTFLYIILNHTKSGDTYAGYRGAQVEGYVQQLQARFRHLGNVIDMGDFNTRNTNEACYQTLVANADSNFRFLEPAFYPDRTLSYPADWNASPAAYAPWLTTSTRQTGLPNSCGSDGGGKSWYDHIFISPWLADGSNYIRYIPSSYRVLGNDGHRTGISINDNSAWVNSSAPAAVIAALFQMSNKYPVMADFELVSNTAGSSPADPDLAAATLPILHHPGHTGIGVINPVDHRLELVLPAHSAGKAVRWQCYRADGSIVRSGIGISQGGRMAWACDLPAGAYWLVVAIGGQTVYSGLIAKND